MMGKVVASTLCVVPLLLTMFAQTQFSGKSPARDLHSLTSASSQAELSTGRALGNYSASVLAWLPQDACSDSVDNCNDPVKYMGSNGDCACFACEYGKQTQHNVCTKNQRDKEKLFKRAKP